MTQTLLINLTPAEIVELVLEKTVKRDGYCIQATSTYLAFLATLHEEIKRFEDVQSYSP